MLDSKDMKSVYSETLMKMVEQDERIMVLEADLMSATGTRPIQERFPDRLINVGVAEANMIGVAAGLSTFGKIPFANTFAAFATRRCYDQICVSVGYARLNVKIVGTDPGIASELNGGTHMAVEDVGLMRTMPTMTVFEPCDNEQLRQALPVIANSYGPIYMRLFRRAPHQVYGTDYEFVLGRADTVREGSDATIIASGIMVWNAIEASNALREKGFSVRVVNMHTIKPIDREAILKAATETGAVVTAENSNIINGLGSAVAEVLCENDAFVPFKRIGIADHFGEVGQRDYLLKKFNMAPEDIVAAVENVISRKMKKEGN